MKKIFLILLITLSINLFSYNGKAILYNEKLGNSIFSFSAKFIMKDSTLIPFKKTSVSWDAVASEIYIKYIIEDNNEIFLCIDAEETSIIKYVIIKNNGSEELYRL